MDDIKLFAKNERELETLIQAVKIWGMEFSIEKYANKEKWKTTNGERNKITKSRKIKTLEERETYRYLEILKADKRRWEKKIKIKKHTSGER